MDSVSGRAGGGHRLQAKHRWVGGSQEAMFHSSRVVYVFLILLAVAKHISQ